MTIYPKPELFDQLCDWSNLLLAFGKAAKGKRSREPAAAYEYRLEDNLIALQDELRQKTYGPGAYNSFYIHDPKKRLISAAPFRDRVVHHALCNVIEPIFEKRFIHDSYANRKGKGTHRAIERAQRFLRRYAYVLPCDIRQFFPSIDHDVLESILDF
jgi:retron-type reverse transcriptase